MHLERGHKRTGKDSGCGTIFKIKDCGGTPGGSMNMLVFIYAC